MNLTRGSVSKQLLLFSAPFLLSSFIQALYNIADMWVVGFYGVPHGQAAINTGGQITLIVTNFIMGFATGGTVLIAQYYGAKRGKDIEQTIGTVFTVLLIASAALTVLMIAVAYPLVLLLQTPADTVWGTFVYIVICMAGNLFVFGYNGISAVLRGLGDSVRPLVIVAVACVLNIGLDFLFVGPFGWGVAGAAFATILAQGVSMFAAGFYLYRKKFIFDFKRKSFRIHKDKLKELLKIGFPSSLQNIVNSVSFLILIVLLNIYGRANGLEDAPAGGAGICAKINSLAILPAIAMGMAVASMAGQNIGAKEYKRAFSTACLGFLYGAVVSVAVFVIVSLFPEQIVGLFNPETTEMAAAGVAYLNSFRWDYLIVPLLFALMGLVNGSGHTLINMVFAMTTSVIFRVPIAILLGFTAGLGIHGIGYSVPAASLGTLVLLFAYVASGKWKKDTVLHIPAADF
ncbi:MAG: MATE family efflux transporter [Clostridiales bacterium]|nr:MATE family efflux transporter [Clostridiales bacterium]